MNSPDCFKSSRHEKTCWIFLYQNDGSLGYRQITWQEPRKVKNYCKNPKELIITYTRLIYYGVETIYFVVFVVK